jgi:hypothetical protein
MFQVIELWYRTSYKLIFQVTNNAYMGLELEMGMLLEVRMQDFQHSEQRKCKKIKACC